MDLSSEEQLAVAMHLASSGKDASEIRKKLHNVCGATAIPAAEVQKCVEQELKKKMDDEKLQLPQRNPSVRRILSKKMKMIKVGDCWRPIFVEEKDEQSSPDKKD